MAHNESVQQMLVNGKCEDVYYSNPETTKKECIRTKQTTKYVQSLTQLAGGTSVFLIPPAMGIQDVILQLQLPVAASGAATGLALPRGWGYSLVRQLSYRIGGSTQFFVTGDQMLQHALKRTTNGTARDDLFALGGSQLTGTDFEAANAANQYAYLWLDLPWTRATSEGKPVPLPSDILASQIQITVELNSLASIISNNGGTIPANFAALQSGQFQVQQLLMESRDDSLAAHVDMSSHSYNMPVEFVQQSQVVAVANTASVQTITATGFRSGSVKSIEMWLTKDSDYVSSSTTKNPLRWYAPLDVQVTYAGDIYARFDVNSSALWNLVNGKLSPKVAGLTLVYTGGAYTAGTPENYAWVSAPFAQTYDAADTSHYFLSEGLSVSSGIVNIAFRTPTAAADYKLHLSYIYCATAVFSQSSCELVF